MSRCKKILQNKSKKAAVGATMSWIIATLVIIGILLIFIYVSILLSKTKAINIGNLKTDSKEYNTLELKTLFAHQLANNKNKGLIDDAIKEQNK
ncbi:MAG: hypothetical protein NTU63_02830 [Candidatus Pacearchaeota archaeon]|nr:hypothetical protein [Candidatus Pacearchaeota archaeon]